MSRTQLWTLLLLIAGWLFSCGPKVVDPPDPVIPSAPELLAAIEISETTVTLRWNDTASDEDGFLIEINETTWSTHDSVAENIEQFVVSELEPGTEYEFRARAYNVAGQSAPSNTVEVTTASDQLVTPPNNVEAEALTSTIVRVTWTDRSSGANFLVSRRHHTHSFETVATLPDNTQQYNDSSVVAETEYIYRVGAQASAGTSWSPDSAIVSTPSPGAPQPPESLLVEVFVGTGIRLTWLDRSTDETEFHIARNITGQNFQNIDTVAANVTTYFDSLLDNPGSYAYRVRAANALGNSTWCFHVGADYRYCSFGAIPICVGNFWSYIEDTGTNQRNISRRISDVGYLNELDYYLEVMNPVSQPDSVDTLMYLRNEINGVFASDYPLSNSSPPQMLFRHPPGSTSQPYFFRQDSVRVLLTSTVVEVGDSVYTGVIVYQRWLHDQENRSIKYWVVPETIGIIREDENEGATTLIRREIYYWWVQEEN